MPNRKAAYGGPAEEKEVIVTVDRRVLYVLGALVLVLALVGGMWFARRTAAPSRSAQAPAAPAQPEVLGNMPEDQARATAKALGLPDSVGIVQSVTRTVQTAPPPGAAGTPDPFGTARALGGKEYAIPTEHVGVEWTHDVLANFPDANLADAKLVPERAEYVKGPLKGPRIAVAELNDQLTYDYGVVPLDRPTMKEFMASNVGDEDLIISRVYTGCGCTALTMGNQPITGSGFLNPPMVLKPGQKVPFTVQFDPRAEGKTGAQAKFVQIYSNDPTKTLFDPKDPNSAEVRFRFVVEPRGKLGAATATPAAQPAPPRP
jgi:hypothetical protein